MRWSPLGPEHHAPLGVVCPRLRTACPSRISASTAFSRAFGSGGNDARVLQMPPDPRRWALTSMCAFSISQARDADRRVLRLETGRGRGTSSRTGRFRRGVPQSGNQPSVSCGRCGFPLVGCWRGHGRVRPFASADEGRAQSSRVSYLDALGASVREKIPGCGAKTHKALLKAFKTELPAPSCRTCGERMERHHRTKKTIWSPFGPVRI